MSEVVDTRIGAMPAGRLLAPVDHPMERAAG